IKGRLADKQARRHLSVPLSSCRMREPAKPSAVSSDMIRSLSLLAVLLPRLVFADCFDWSVSVWPPLGHPLPANGQLVIEGYGELQEQVSRIAERSPRLVADEDEVPL